MKKLLALALFAIGSSSIFDVNPAISRGIGVCDVSSRVDDASLSMSDSETKALRLKAKRLSVEFSVEVFVCLTSAANLPNPGDVADQALQELQENRPGESEFLVTYVDLMERRVAFRVSGSELSDWEARIETLLKEVMSNKLRNGRNYDAFSSALSEFEKIVLIPLKEGTASQAIQSEPKYDPPSKFVQSVVWHVLYHELAHALIREFSLPVLANEEAMADSFASVWITQNHREEAPEIILARVRSWLLEDSEVEPEDYDFKGEHLLDIRRAYQAACLLYGSDPAEWGHQVTWLKISERDLADCSDTTPDQIDGWAEILDPYRLQKGGDLAKNVRIIYGEGPLKGAMMETKLMENFALEAAKFDWPHQITLHFDHCDRGAYWSRSTRTIMLCDNYVLRFMEQGRTLASAKN